MRFLAVLLLLLLLVIPVSACHPAFGFSYGGGYASSYSLVTPGVGPALVGAYYQPPVANVGFVAAPAPLVYQAPAPTLTFAAPQPALSFTAPQPTFGFAAQPPIATYGATFAAQAPVFAAPVPFLFRHRAFPFAFPLRHRVFFP